MEQVAAARSESAGRRPWLELAGWIALWVIARGALLVTFCDVFGYLEEMEKACAGKAMLDGLRLPQHELAYHYYEGGGFVVSHLDALAFRLPLVGESLLAIKLVALALGVAILTAGWKLCERVGGSACARAFALLYVFAPESVQKNSLLALGIHYHATLFIALVLLAAVVIGVERDSRAGRLCLAGLAAGFGLYFSYQLALTLAVVGGWLAFELRGELLRRRSSWLALGFVLGIAPLLWMVWQVGPSVLDIHGADVVDSKQPKGELLAQFFDSIFGGRSLGEVAAIALFVATPALGVFALRRTQTRSLRIAAGLVLAHIVLFLAAYLGLGFTVGRVISYFSLHRLTPLWFLMIVLAAFGVAASPARGKFALRAVAWALVSLCVCCGAVDTYHMLQGALPLPLTSQFKQELGSRLTILARTKGYSYPQYLQKIVPHIQGSRVDKLHTFLAFDEEDPQLLHEAIAVALYVDGNPPLEEMERELDQAGVARKRDFELGFGMNLRNSLGGDMASRTAALQAQPSPLRETLIEAVGRMGNRYFPSEDGVLKEIQQAVDANLPAALFRGLGARLHDARGDASIAHYFEQRKGPLSLDRERAFALIEKIPLEARGQLWAGYCEAHLRHWLDGFAR